ncbi:hypothetical protein HOLleu_19711 [Holothuria leucospilota]|uniref:Uncharacterized protein n=1 Tax=Holothuria leucospilota TaxID=206669 RepID=A0A9Q1H846_HOLLE|nr:hypothetical protein HOLleu_19711 [Holothuria leucospilota]
MHIAAIPKTISITPKVIWSIPMIFRTFHPHFLLSGFWLLMTPGFAAGAGWFSNTSC